MDNVINFDECLIINWLTRVILNTILCYLPSIIVYFQLNINLEKIEALEGKIKSEMVSLKEKMSKMEEELLTYSDLVS